MLRNVGLVSYACAPSRHQTTQTGVTSLLVLQLYPWTLFLNRLLPNLCQYSPKVDGPKSHWYAKTHLSSQNVHDSLTTSKTSSHCKTKSHTNRKARFMRSDQQSLCSVAIKKKNMKASNICWYYDYIPSGFICHSHLFLVSNSWCGLLSDLNHQMYY